MHTYTLTYLHNYVCASLPPSLPLLPAYPPISPLLPSSPGGNSDQPRCVRLSAVERYLAADSQPRQTLAGGTSLNYQKITTAFDRLASGDLFVFFFVEVDGWPRWPRRCPARHRRVVIASAATRRVGSGDSSGRERDTNGSEGFESVSDSSFGKRESEREGRGESPLARSPSAPPACGARAYIRRACWVRGFCVFTARTQTS